ncbi:hypothetical protein RchiOBHm_Chr5g0032121 [Rosa chinensis]|uniref:Zinc knuckle CX2CX4HX4C domain-containing protein n=1 Tax=Rosa chinensis TaxID=74649 RepID=A0A2P6QAC6_ROSCH|nr:hypothetical protein RchiOBHm_Chr5g0032121 [Rosa chinensis]
MVVGERFVFQFDRESDWNKYLHGGPWFYRNAMLVIAPYDGVSPIDSVPLHTMEIWMAVRGLPRKPRNKFALSMIGSATGEVVKFDQVAMRRNDAEQRIQLVIDTRRCFRFYRKFSFSPVVAVDLAFVYEKVKGLCKSCGLFVHDVEGCDLLFVKEQEALPDGIPVGEMADLSITTAAEVSRPSPAARVFGVVMSPRQPRISGDLGFLTQDVAVKALKHRNQAAFFSHLTVGFQASGLMKNGLLSIPNLATTVGGAHWS